jgi:hypothetical protein
MIFAGFMVAMATTWSRAECRAVGIDVAVQVDQARRHQLAGGVEHAQRPLRRDVGLERLDHPIADADVAPAPQRLARVEHVAALDDEIELVVRTHGGERPAAGRGECEGTGGGEKIAA